MSDPITISKGGTKVARLYVGEGSMVIVCAACSAPCFPGDGWPTGPEWCEDHTHVDTTIAEWVESLEGIPPEVIASGDWLGVVDTERGSQLVEVETKRPLFFWRL